MKQMFCTLSCLLLTVSLAACGSETGNQKPAYSVAASKSVETQSRPQTRRQPLHDFETVSEKTRKDLLQEPVMEQTNETNAKDKTVTKMNVQVGNTTFTATLESNTAVNEFIQMMQEAPVVIDMSDYSGFEKAGSLGTGLTADNSQINTQTGDIVLYNGNQIVIFYDSHSWNYTKLGKIDDLSGWTEALGSGNVEVTFSVME